MAVEWTDTLSNRLRRDVGATDDILTNEMAEELYEEALETYPNDSAKAIAFTRVLALRGIRASAAMLGKYAQNQSEEDLTKVFDNIGDMLKDFAGEVEKAADPVEITETTPFFFGRAPGYRGR